MDFNTIKMFLTNKTEWKRVKEAQAFFENKGLDKEDLQLFLNSEWTLDDLSEALEMIETNPVAQEVKEEHIEKYETAIQQAVDNAKKAVDETIPETKGSNAISELLK